jgi:hypothetical protein
MRRGPSRVTMRRIGGSASEKGREGAALLSRLDPLSSYFIIFGYPACWTLYYECDKTRKGVLK